MRFFRDVDAELENGLISHKNSERSGYVAPAKAGICKRVETGLQPSLYDNLHNNKKEGFAWKIIRRTHNQLSSLKRNFKATRQNNNTDKNYSFKSGDW